MSNPVRLIQGVNHPTYVFTWKDENGDAVNLTGATITGRIKNTNTGTVASCAGTFALVTATSGIFSYVPHENDSATVGKNYLIQFKATFGDGTIDKTFTMPLWVEEAI